MTSASITQSPDETTVRSLWQSPWLKWGILALIQLAFIAIPLADRLNVQMTGTEVTLEVRPIDPRDLLRGDYVIINLAITRLDAGLAKSGETLSSGDKVYVGVDADGDGLSQPTLITANRSVAGPLAIAGIVRSVSDATVVVDYDLDAFYVPEGTGLEIERMDSSRIRLVARVADDGRSLPVRLLVDGQPFKSEQAF
ncbi:GDYXXLXY domain-containing protein [Roseibium polysiphoniae]|uniref:GDYXXLXY domain-containing protein n=1 Tax=Roseibium polysiphoniae TaxID=2571221 RepID=A0ABR9CG34_9HYPH|nr:GDYXXLXY domain-containing protein [Roseibium polysiphoniae]MBD8878829.1 GDYXXLXY domain-containing protein [Roseibium polysiphoniae]